MKNGDFVLVLKLDTVTSPYLAVAHFELRENVIRTRGFGLLTEFKLICTHAELLEGSLVEPQHILKFNLIAHPRAERK